MVRILLFLIIAFCSLLQAQTISVGVETDSTDYLVGDFIDYKVEVVTRKNIELLSPSLPDSILNLEFISRVKPLITESDQFRTTVFTFILAGYDSVRATIPPLEMDYRAIGDSTYKTITTDSISVNIHTVPVSTAEDIKDVKSPLLIPYSWLMLILWIAIVLVVILIVWYSYRRYKSKQAEKPVEKRIIKIPPHVKAFRALEELEAEQLWQKGRIKDYHSRITEIIRRYFEERFNFISLELTTTETMMQLRNIKESEIIHGSTYEFLSNADLVKFAKFQPLDSVNVEMMNQAREIVQKTIGANEAEEDEIEELESEEVNVQ